LDCSRSSSRLRRFKGSTAPLKISASEPAKGGVAPEIIALWLGHESPNTTHLYVEADLRMKRQALEALVPPKTQKAAKPDADPLIRILQNL
jgi:integrase